jgi:hypothetical protein
MGSSLQLSVLACACLVGCASSVQVGLANAPVLGGATAEARVHDAIANGKEPVGAAVPVFLFRPQPSTWNAPGYPLGACPNAWPGPTGAEKGMTAISLSPSGRLVCSGPW